MAAGALAVILPAAASRRGFFPLCLGSVTFLAFVPQLEALSESLTRFIPRSFLVVALSVSAVGFADALWLCPERALSRFFALVSLINPVALLPLLHHVFADGFPSLVRISLMQWGVFPMCLVPLGPLGSCGWLHLYRLTPDLVGLCHFAVWLWSSGRCFLFFLCDVPYVNMAIILSVSLPPTCPCLVFTIGCSSLDTWTRRVDGLTLCPLPRSSRFLSFALTYKSRQSNPDASCDGHSVAVSLSPSLTVAMTPCNCGTREGLSSWLAPYLIPHRVVSLSLPALGACCA